MRVHMHRLSSEGVGFQSPPHHAGTGLALTFKVTQLSLMTTPPTLELENFLSNVAPQAGKWHPKGGHPPSEYWICAYTLLQTQYGVSCSVYYQTKQASEGEIPQMCSDT